MFTFILTLALIQNAPPLNPELKAAMLLGTKTAMVQKKLPVLNQVVLVPDEATYLDEIARWTPKKRWPVLFNQEPFASQFIRTFSPEKIWLRESVGKIKNIATAMQHTVANAWGGETSIEDALKKLQFPPLGVVLTSPSDPARTAAVALAAGRGQLLLYMSNDWGETTTSMPESKTSELITAINSTLNKTGLSYNSIGDEVDVLTVCMSLPARVDCSYARENPVAVSDVIGRDEDGKRFAWTGWIFGSRANSAYTAMCSLFLERDNYWLCNTYPNNGGWAAYSTDGIVGVLQQYGIQCTTVGGTLAALQAAEVDGVTADVLYFTTKGNQDFFDMSDSRTAPTWLPILNSPATLYFVHSWSLKNPTVQDTVGGTWLSRGVYAYVGSSHEPMLQAFVPPVEVMRRTVSYIPFLLASRWSSNEGQRSKVWRVNTIGDPLMLCPPKSTMSRTILPPLHADLYTDAALVAKSNMKLAAEIKTDSTFANAIRSAILLGNDEIAVSLWIVAINENVRGEIVARAALPALFRQGALSDFIVAFTMLKTPKRLEKDMLWQLSSKSNETPLPLLMDNFRSPYKADDLLVIADRIVSQRGTGTLLRCIDNLLSKARGRTERELKRMRKKYGN
ncbi:MAG: hypothetical protein HOC21_02705 [Phycisphaerae bacterium]|nr:hypothetical protein [Phycisphaerae bacterium]